MRDGADAHKHSDDVSRRRIKSGNGVGRFVVKTCDSSLYVSLILFAFLLVERVSCAVAPAQLSSSSNENEDFLLNPKYLDNHEIRSLFENLQREYPHLARAYIIGQTVEKRDLNVLALSAPGEDAIAGDLLRPVVKVTANIHGDETVGRQIVLYLAQYLTKNYANVPEVQQLLNTTKIHLMPSCNPDGFAAAKVSLNNSKKGKSYFFYKGRVTNSKP